jgi:hypothetical protein
VGRVDGMETIHIDVVRAVSRGRADGRKAGIKSRELLLRWTLLEVGGLEHVVMVEVAASGGRRVALGIQCRWLGEDGWQLGGGSGACDTGESHGPVGRCRGPRHGALSS